VYVPTGATRSLSPFIRGLSPFHSRGVYYLHVRILSAPLSLSVAINLRNYGKICFSSAWCGSDNVARKIFSNQHGNEKQREITFNDVGQCDSRGMPRECRLSRRCSKISEIVSLVIVNARFRWAARYPPRIVTQKGAKGKKKKKKRRDAVGIV